MRRAFEVGERGEAPDLQSRLAVGGRVGQARLDVGRAGRPWHRQRVAVERRLQRRAAQQGAQLLALRLEFALGLDPLHPDRGLGHPRAGLLQRRDLARAHAVRRG